jgi:hypothetical protein
VLDIAVYKNVRLSEIIFSDTLDSDELSFALHLLNHIRTRNLSGPGDKFTEWERFRCVAYELISLKSKLSRKKKPIK